MSTNDSEKRRRIMLTLSPRAVEKAERVAAARGTSVSRLVDDLLRAIPNTDSRPLANELTPAVQRLRGVARDSAFAERSHNSGTPSDLRYRNVSS